MLARLMLVNSILGISMLAEKTHIVMGWSSETRPTTFISTITVVMSVTTASMAFPTCAMQGWATALPGALLVWVLWVLGNRAPDHDRAP